MRKNKRYIFVLIFLVVSLYLIYSSIYNHTYNNNFKPSYKNYYETLIYPNESEIIYDEQYALNTAIYIYSKLYNKNYTKEDFIIDDDIGWLEVPCWHIYLNKSRILNNGTVATYDFPEGLMIYKKTGAVLVNYGEMTI